MKTLTYIGNVLPDGTIKLPKRLRAEVGKAFANELCVHFVGGAVHKPGI